MDAKVPMEKIAALKESLRSTKEQYERMMEAPEAEDVKRELSDAYRDRRVMISNKGIGHPLYSKNLSDKEE